jgi:hypothetical protein
MEDFILRIIRSSRIIESAEVSADVLVAALRQAFDNPQFGPKLDIMSQVFCARQPASAATIISVLDQLLALSDDFNAPELPVTATATIGLIARQIVLTLTSKGVGVSSRGGMSSASTPISSHPPSRRRGPNPTMPTANWLAGHRTDRSVSHFRMRHITEVVIDVSSDRARCKRKR